MSRDPALAAWEGRGQFGILLASHPDGPIGELLFEFSTAYLTFEADTPPEEEWSARVDAYEEVRTRLLETPATTIEGLAIKSYVALHWEFGGDNKPGMGIDLDGGSMKGGGNISGLITDCLRLSPALRALTEA